MKEAEAQAERVTRLTARRTSVLRALSLEGRVILLARTRTKERTAIDDVSGWAEGLSMCGALES